MIRQLRPRFPSAKRIMGVEMSQIFPAVNLTGVLHR